MTKFSEIQAKALPQNQIVLSDGSIIYGIPKNEALAAPIDNTLRLDTNGEYLAVENKKRPILQPAIRPQDSNEKNLFCENAFFFLYHREAILKDSRLFLTPVNMVNGLAYTGTSGFRSPTLGVYVEWWLNCKSSMYYDKEEYWIVCQISGSPLSGMNSCVGVNSDGETETHHSTSFSSLWSNFQKINTRYDSAKMKFQAYTLSEAIEVLKSFPPQKYEMAASLQIFFQQREIDSLWNVIEQYQNDMRKLRDEVTDLTIRVHYDFVAEVYNRYKKDAALVSSQLDDAYEKRKALRQLLRQGRITNKEYQQQLHPVNKIIKEAYPHLISKYINSFREIDPSPTIFDVVDFFKKQNAKAPNSLSS